MFSTFVAAFPVVRLYSQGLGLDNSLCVMMLSFKSLDSWYVLIVLAINTSFSVCTIAMYVSITHVLRNRQKELSKKRTNYHQRQQQSSITVRIVCILLTNSTCWLVMVFLGILVETGVIIQGHVFSICAVTVLPISALLNPIINFFTTSAFVKSCKKLI